MERYINADKMLKEYQETLCFNVLCSLCPFLDNIKDDTCQVEKWINEQPTADVVPRARYDKVMDNLKAVLEERDVLENVKGEWICCEDDEWIHYECSVCGEIIHHETLNFCPNCGADMRGEV